MAETSDTKGRRADAAARRGGKPCGRVCKA